MPFYMSLEFSDFALMFAAGSDYGMPAQGGDTGVTTCTGQTREGSW